MKNNLENINYQKYNKISNTKTKTMVFLWNNLVRIKIVSDNNVLEQESHFNYLVCDISYRIDTDIEGKLHKFSYICGRLR